MQLTLEEAATRLGKSLRQVRYMVQKKQLPARKLAGRWFIESDELPLSDGQKRAADRKRRALKAAVEETLGLSEEPERQRRYSIRDLKAFQVALPLQRRTAQALGEDHPASRSLRSTLARLSQGCHRFNDAEKAESYRQARDQASLALCELALAQSADADAMLKSTRSDLSSNEASFTIPIRAQSAAAPIARPSDICSGCAKRSFASSLTFAATSLRSTTLSCASCSSAACGPATLQQAGS